MHRVLRNRTTADLKEMWIYACTPPPSYAFITPKACTVSITHTKYLTLFRAIVKITAFLESTGTYSYQCFTVRLALIRAKEMIDLNLSIQAILRDFVVVLRHSKEMLGECRFLPDPTQRRVVPTLTVPTTPMNIHRSAASFRI
jgi:hypothetical protein